nr:DUF4158 domain-containing protein [Azospirillum cavernae]
MPRHRLLNENELRHLFGVPADREALARHFTLTSSDHDLVLTRRGDANRLGFAVQLALLRQSGRALAQVEEPIDPLVVWISAQIDAPTHLFADCARRPMPRPSPHDRNRRPGRQDHAKAGSDRHRHRHRAPLRKAHSARPLAVIEHTGAAGRPCPQAGGGRAACRSHRRATGQTRPTASRSSRTRWNASRLQTAD